MWRIDVSDIGYLLALATFILYPLFFIMIHKIHEHFKGETDG